MIYSIALANVGLFAKKTKKTNANLLPLGNGEMGKC